MDTIANSLVGKFLVATPKMPDKRFAEQVIFICTHTPEDGAMGLAVNKPYGQVAFGDILSGVAPFSVEQMTEIHIGGPVEPEAGFILFETVDYHAKEEVQVTDTIAVSREKQVLEDLAAGRGPANYLFLLGYAGWGAGQLEMELTRNGWLVVPAGGDIIFRMESRDKWQAAASAYGINIALFDDEAGSA